MSQPDTPTATVAALREIVRELRLQYVRYPGCVWPNDLQQRVAEALDGQEEGSNA